LGKFSLCCLLEAAAVPEAAVDAAVAVLAQATDQVVVLAGVGTIPGSDLVMEPVTAVSVPPTARVMARVMGLAAVALVPDMDLVTVTDLVMVQGRAVMAQVTAQAIIMAQGTVQAVADLVPAGARGTIKVPLAEQEAPAAIVTEKG
jgi:hypothetical protein